VHNEGAVRDVCFPLPLAWISCKVGDKTYADGILGEEDGAREVNFPAAVYQGLEDSERHGK